MKKNKKLISLFCVLICTLVIAPVVVSIAEANHNHNDNHHECSVCESINNLQNIFKNANFFLIFVVLALKIKNVIKMFFYSKDKRIRSTLISLKVQLTN